MRNKTAYLNNSVDTTDFNPKVGREDIFKTIGNESLHKN